MTDRLSEIRERLAKARLGPWKTADYMDKSVIGRNWELADFGECAHHNRKVWMTTDNQPASMSNGACPCEDADFCAHAREDIPFLLGLVEEAEKREREAVARAFETAADICNTRATDAKLKKIRSVVADELMNRRDHFLAMAAAVRRGEGA